MKTKCETFNTSVREFKLAQKHKQEVVESLKKSVLEQTRRAQKRRQKKTENLLMRAILNLDKLMRCDAEFTDYLVQLFRSNRAVKISDGSGACGFPPPPIRWQNCGNSELAPGLGVGSTQIMVGKEEDYEILVSVLVLYSEYESIKKLQEGLECADGEYRQQTCPVLALTARCDHFSAPNRDQVKDFRLVVIEQQIESSLLMTSYSRLSSVSLDPGFITVLNKLSSAKSTFDYFLKEFGPPR